MRNRAQDEGSRTCARSLRGDGQEGAGESSCCAGVSNKVLTFIIEAASVIESDDLLVGGTAVAVPAAVAAAAVAAPRDKLSKEEEARETRARENKQEESARGYKR